MDQGLGREGDGLAAAGSRVGGGSDLNDEVQTALGFENQVGPTRTEERGQIKAGRVIRRGETPSGSVGQGSVVAILRRVPGDQAFTVDERPVTPQLGFQSGWISDSQLGDINGRQGSAPEADLLDGAEERRLPRSIEANLKRPCRGADAVSRIAAQRFQVSIDVDPHGVVVAVEDCGDVVPAVGLDASGGRFQNQFPGPDAGGGRGAQEDVAIGMEPQSVFAVLAATGAVGRVAFPQDVLPLARIPIGPDPGAD